MAQNIEIKCRVPNVSEMEKRVRELTRTDCEILYQEDVFYRADQGKLKLRIFPDGTGDLISYSRDIIAGPKLSDYFIYKADDAQMLRQVLDRSFQIIGVVRKERKLYKKGRTRIHLDRVENLGDFLELEVVLQNGEDLRTGEEEAFALMQALQLPGENLCDKAYIDLILEKEDRFQVA